MCRTRLLPALLLLMLLLESGGAVALAHAVGTRTAATPDFSAGPDSVGQWSPVMSWPLVAVHAILMRTGKVLTWEDHSDDPDAALVWDPADDTFASVPTDGINLFCAGHCSLPDGRVLVDGGHVGLDIGVPSATAFDPISQTWTSLAPMTYARWYPTVTPLPDGRVCATSGAIDCETCIADIPEVYNPDHDSWTQLHDAPRTLPLYPFMFVLPDGRLLAAGSSEAATPTRALDLDTQTWTMIDSVVVDGGSAAMFRPGMVLKCGSSQDPQHPAGIASAGTYVLDMSQPNPAWRQTASMAFPRFYHSLTLLPGGNVLVTGGSTDPDVHDINAAVHEAEMWSPVTERWTTMARMVTPRLYHSIALLLPDGRVLVAGSGRFNGPGAPDSTDQRSAEIYSPPYLFRGARPVIDQVPATIQYGSSFRVETPDAESIAAVSLLRPGADTHAFNMDQRYVGLTFTASQTDLVVDAPVDRNQAPPGYYMLFIVNSRGVPSLASFVQLPVYVDTQRPSPPTNVISDAMTGSVKLSWSPGSDDVGVTEYNIHRSTSAIFIPTSVNRIGYTGSTTYTDGGLAPGNYFYILTAEDAAGNVSGPSNEIGATVTVGPGSLIAAYSFGEGGGSMVTDFSGYANTGYVMDAGWASQGRYGGALSFNGNTGYLDLRNSPSLQKTGSMTWSAWVKAFADPPDDGQILAKSGGGSGSIGWQLKTTPDTGPQTFGIAVSADGTSITQRYSRTARDLNRWYYVAGVYDSAAARLDIYVDGVLDNGALLGRVPSRQHCPNVNVNVGRRSGGYYFNGVVDEVRIYDRALTQAEIVADMNTPIEGGVGAAPEVLARSGYRLDQSYPNPCDRRTTMSYAIPNEGRVLLEVFDVGGGLVATLEDRVRPAGRYEVTLEARGLASGVYLCRMKAGDVVVCRKLFILH